MIAVSYCLILPAAFAVQISNTIANDNREFLTNSNINLRILGGKYAHKSQFPHQVLLVTSSSSICGGSIISKEYILTAKHCVQSAEPKDVIVRAGSIIFNSGGIILRTLSIKLHLNQDLALIQLETALQFGTFIKPIELSKEAVPSGANVTVSGWGRILNDGPLATHLKYNVLKALSIEECNYRIGSLSNNILCLAHTEDNGVCSGDSGGPAMYKNRLVGVANFVINYCGSIFPDGYGSIRLNYDWIVQNLKKNQR